ncbi:hypothetical protein SAY86_029072 [Trapa natans]|uniref:BZIP domain-containing protein n=1 Tax=Trapa natans TaxID=22666 RepID=A0AAN7MKC0_TRANT|nr:hypothetical protein SAY86_029072 [Trapa natans]
MAQLPPKIPSSMAAMNWPDFHPHGRLLPPPPAHNLSLVDDYLDFSSARRAVHQRSISDSIALVESPAGGVDHHGQFDDGQFPSIFAEEKKRGYIGTGPFRSSSGGGSSSPQSDNNSSSEKKQSPSLRGADDQIQVHGMQLQQRTRNENDEVDSFCKQEAPDTTVNTETDQNSTDRTVDPKRVKRILANRQSAQRSRVRKLHYISELERSVNSLQAEVSVLSPRVAFFDHQRLLLNVDNSALKQRIAVLAQDKIFKDAHQEALKREIERLNQIYEQQQ